MTDGKNETIVDRVVERLKRQPLGDLITDEDLFDIVKQAIPKVFFEKRFRTENPGSYHARTVELPPLINETVEAVLKPAIDVHVKAWIAENAEMVTEHWKKVVDVGLQNYVLKMQEAKAQEQCKEMLKALVEVLNKERQNAGLPPIPLYF